MSRLYRRLHLWWLRTQRTAALAAADQHALDPDPRSGQWMADAIVRSLELGVRIQSLECEP